MMLTLVSRDNLSGRLDSVEWNGGMEWWNGIVEWNGTVLR